MYLRQSVSRRRFMGGAATALGYFGLKPSGELWAESLRESTDPVVQDALAEYDAFAKISFNENPDGPSDRAMDAMNMAFKYSMRYGHPDGNIQGKIAAQSSPNGSPHRKTLSSPATWPTSYGVTFSVKASSSPSTTCA